MAGIISAILALAKAVPIIDSWIQQLSAAYVVSKMASLKQENLDAIREAMANYDQRKLETAIGNPNPGEASGDAGATIISSKPPGVH